MSYTYAQRKRPQGQQTAEPEQTAAPGPGMDALMAGMARPSAAQKGRPFDLDAAMKAKMENAFGDLSAVRLYESRAVGEAGAEAIAQGNESAFAPGMANFSTKAGQERLGHELSHVMSQRSGQVRGSGFLADSALEARADREGAMAAAGQQVYTGPVTHALSGASPSSMAAGAMQAKRDEKQKLEPELIHDKQHWGDVKWGPLKNWKHKRANLKNKLEYSEDKEAVLRRQWTDQAMADDGLLNDSVYIPDPEGDDEAGYNTTDDPILQESQKKKRSKSYFEDAFDPDLRGFFYPEEAKQEARQEAKPKKKWYQFWK